MSERSSIDILVLDGRKGGNPGSMCTIKGHNQVGEGYIKYAPGSHMKSELPFNANHQPFYEAITNHYINKAGLCVPETFVVYNDERVNFKDAGPSANKENIGQGDRYYFLSKKIEPVKKGSDEERDKKWKENLERDSPYLEMFCVGDVIGKRDNAFYTETRHPHNIYFDLGCGLGFRAKQGVVEMNNKLISSVKKDKKFKKKTEKNLSKWDLLSRNKSERLNFKDLVEEIPFIKFNFLNSQRKEKISDFLYESEIEGIQNMVSSVFENSIKKYKNTEFIKKSGK